MKSLALAFMLLTVLLAGPAFVPTDSSLSRVSAAPLAPCELNWQVVPSPALGTRALVISNLKMFAPDDGWAFGSYYDNGGPQILMLHWDGAQWTRRSTPPNHYQNYLRAFDGSSPENFWAIGFYGALRWDGKDWYTIAKGFGPNLDIWGLSVLDEQNVWIVGARHRPAEKKSLAYVRRWDGTRWVKHHLTGITEAQVHLGGVHARTPDDVWIVGYAVGGDGTNYPLVEHWNGNKWQRIPIPAAETGGLSYIYALSPTAVWAAGIRTTGAEPRNHPFAMFWNGTAWQTTDLPPAGPASTDYLSGVTALSENDVWLAGTTLRHWDGSQWSIVSTPTRGDPAAVHGTAGDDVWVGTTAGTLAHFDGSSWKAAQTPDVGDGAGLTSAAALADNDVWAVGSYFDGATDLSLIEHWNGAAWQVVPSPNTPDGSNRLVGIRMFAPDDGWAWNSELILRWDGSAWKSSPSPFPGALSIHQLSGDSPGNFWLNGTRNGLPYLAHWNGAGWLDMSSLLPTDRTISVLDVHGPNLMYAFAYRSLPPTTPDTLVTEYSFLHGDGTTWSTLASYTITNSIYTGASNLGTPLMLSDTDVWAVLTRATKLYTIQSLVHWNGTEWQETNSAEKIGNVNSLRALDAQNIWLAGSYWQSNTPFLQSWNGSEWHEVAFDALPDLTALRDTAILNATDVWVVGSSGDRPVVLHGSGCASVPGSPSLISPQENAALAKQHPVLRWQDTVGTWYAGLDIRRRRDTPWVSPTATGGRYQIDQTLDPGKDYFWRVRDCNDAGCSDWSEWRRFTIKE